MPTVGSHQQGAFATPVNGQSIDASVVLSNDNATRTTTNAHDADATIHVQSSLLASRPAAGTAGRPWITSDGLRFYLDSGSVWNELDYLSKTGGGTVAGAVTLGASLTVTGTTNLNSDIAVSTNKVTIAAASGNTGIAGTLSVTGLVTANSGLAVAGNSTITGTLSGITTLTATSLAGTLTTAAQPNITSVGTLSSLAVSGTATLGMATTSAGSGSYGSGVGTTIGSVSAGEVYLVIARSQSTNHYAYALAVGSAVIGSVVVTSLGASGLMIGTSGVSITLTNGTAGTLTLDHSLLKLR